MTTSKEKQIEQEVNNLLHEQATRMNIKQLAERQAIYYATFFRTMMREGVDIDSSFSFTLHYMNFNMRKKRGSDEDHRSFRS